MSTDKRSRVERALARISLGAVPMDGIYWIDPKAAAKVVASKRNEAPSSCEPSAHGVPTPRAAVNGVPAHAASTQQAPARGASAHEAFTHVASTCGASAHETLAHVAPALGVSTHEVFAHGAPTIGAPTRGISAHVVPAHGASVNGDPHGSSTPDASGRRVPVSLTFAGLFRWFAPNRGRS